MEEFDQQDVVIAAVAKAQQEKADIESHQQQPQVQPERNRLQQLFGITASRNLSDEDAMFINKNKDNLGQFLHMTSNEERANLLAMTMTMGQMDSVVGEMLRQSSLLPDQRVLHNKPQEHDRKSWQELAAFINQLITDDVLHMFKSQFHVYTLNQVSTDERVLRQKMDTTGLNVAKHFLKAYNEFFKPDVDGKENGYLMQVGVLDLFARMPFSGVQLMPCFIKQFDSTATENFTIDPQTALCIDEVTAGCTDMLRKQQNSLSNMGLFLELAGHKAYTNLQKVIVPYFTLDTPQQQVDHLINIMYFATRCELPFCGTLPSLWCDGQSSRGREDLLNHINAHSTMILRELYNRADLGQFNDVMDADNPWERVMQSVLTFPQQRQYIVSIDKGQRINTHDGFDMREQGIIAHACAVLAAALHVRFQEVNSAQGYSRYMVNPIDLFYADFVVNIASRYLKDLSEQRGKLVKFCQGLKEAMVQHNRAGEDFILSHASAATATKTLQDIRKIAMLAIQNNQSRVIKQLDVNLLVDAVLVQLMEEERNEDYFTKRAMQRAAQVRDMTTPSR